MNDTPTRIPVRVMVTAESSPAAFAAIQSLDVQSAEFEARANEIKERATAELSALRDEVQAKHKAAWGTIEEALGLDKDRSHSVCTQHVDAHGIAFVRDAEDDDSDDSDDAPGGGLPAGLGLGGLPAGPGLGLGLLLARALGGNVVSEDDNGGVIEVPLNQ
jgi:hypothetical protein